MSAKTKNQIIDYARKLEKAGASSDEIEEYVSLASKELSSISQSETQQPIRPPTFTEKSVNVLKQIPRPPIPLSIPEITPEILGSAKSFMSPLTSPTGKKIEEFSGNVKKAGREGVERVVSSPEILSQFPKTKAVTGTLVDTLIESLPFSPQEMSIAIGSEVTPIAFSKNVKSFTKHSSENLSKLQKKIANEFLDTDVKLLQKERRTGIKSLSDKFIERVRKGVFGGSREEVAEQSDEIVEQYENAIQDKLSKISKEEGTAKYNTIQRENISRAFDNAKKDFIEGLDKNEIDALEEMKLEFLKESKLSGNVEYWNGVKRKLYKQIGDKNYIKDTQSFKINAKKQIARAIKEEIEGVVPDIKELNKRQGEYLQIRDSLNMLLGKKDKKGIRESLKMYAKEKASLEVLKREPKITEIKPPSGFSGINLPLIKFPELER